MARLRCEVLERDGTVPRMVRDETGRLLRLHDDAPPSHAAWFGTVDGVGMWAETVPGGAPTPIDALEIVWLDTPLTSREGAHDEVGVVVGPDRGDALGLFDSPTTASTGEHTEGPSSGPERVGEQRRTAVLAWIAAAQEPLVAAPVEPGAPCEPLKRLVADEPLDPLPALDGVPRAKPHGEPRRALAPELASEREDTATQIEGFEAMVERRGDGEPTASDLPAPTPAPIPAPVARTPPSPRGLLLVALVVVGLAWVLLRVDW
ncbi:MAG: hypothetical protein Q8P41_19155 [Pseudomonadota bacterium]|nr:hypothetical protein [Pseudomonadota bacterium]